MMSTTFENAKKTLCAVHAKLVTNKGELMYKLGAEAPQKF